MLFTDEDKHFINIMRKAKKNVTTPVNLFVNSFILLESGYLFLYNKEEFIRFNNSSDCNNAMASQCASECITSLSHPLGHI